MIITLQTLIFFRESLINALDRLVRPYYNKLYLAFGRTGEATDDEESDEQVFAEYDEERGVVFYPPMYLQRYAAVSDCLMDEQWKGKLTKVVDLGYHDMSFINYLKEVPGIKCILGVDLESIPLRCSIDLVGCEDYVPKRENPLEVTLFKGNAADPDYRLIGCDAVIAIEMIEHMLPHDLDRLIHTVFGFIKPWIAIFTTPNGNFNSLFKNLEKNGLRRLDHFFEWSQDQFHDWCSNIVVRYPQYTVSCKGIGPGPLGTQHLGCCSQMAVFVSKEYNKQQDLNLNSLALVSESPSPHSISNLISSWESPDVPNETNVIEPPKNADSYIDLQSAIQSSITLVLSTSSSSQDTVLYQDQMSQCNLDVECDRGFMMFDYEQMCFDILRPRRKMNNHRIYQIEDVYNRLNCTTLEVKKFSKTTLNLMAKNKLDTLVHTREVVDEIRHLTKMLNFNKELNNQLDNGFHTWYNINWGENAPYWNQYYKIVKAYNYPFEVKSDECRILDLISDEINRLIDSQLDEDFSFEACKLEIPIELLMRVVEHITDDVEKVKDLLEWNGYEVLGNFVIHSRMLTDYSSAGTQDEVSPEATDVLSDWDSTSLSDGSTPVPDIHARCLRRALDQKVRRLRSMLTADEDITTELDRVVCRLMKLALRTSKGRGTPPPTRWMQCKLLDLLTLTEKTIERRKKHFIESYPLKAINCVEKSQEMIALEKIKEDDTAMKIVDKYKHLVNQTEDMNAEYKYLDFELEDEITIESTEFAKDFEFTEKHAINIPNLECEPIVLDTEMFEREDAPQDSKLQRTQAWVEEDIEVVPYPIHDCTLDNSTIETNGNIAKLTTYYKKKIKRKHSVELNCVTRKKSQSKAHKRHRPDDKIKDNSKTKLDKKIALKKSSNGGTGAHTTGTKFASAGCGTYIVSPQRKQQISANPTAAKPIPTSLIELCNPKMMIENNVTPFNLISESMTKIDNDKRSYNMEMAETKESMLIEIVTATAQETIALRRTIGTDADADSMVFEEETLIRSVSNAYMNEHDVSERQHNMPTENVHSQTIFLYDIDEPTTSKGIRHRGMDVQCGPDSAAPIYSSLSTTTSLTRVPNMFKTGIKIGGCAIDSNLTSTDFGICTYDSDNNYKTVIPRDRSVGIKIKDSDSDIIINKIDFASMPTCTTLSATTSLIALPKILKQGSNNVDAQHHMTRNTGFGIYIHTPENVCNIESSSDTNEPFDQIQDAPNGTKIYKSIPQTTEKSSTIQTECTTNAQELYDKLIESSQQLFVKEAEISGDVSECNNFNLPTRILCPTKSKKSFLKSKSLSKPTFKKRVTIERKQNSKSLNAPQKTRKYVHIKVSDSDSESLHTETQYLSDAKFNVVSRTSGILPSISKQLTLTISKLQELSVGLESKENLNIPVTINDSTNDGILKSNTCNESQEITLPNVRKAWKIDEATADNCLDVDSTYNIIDEYNLRDVTVRNKTENNYEEPKDIKRKLCSGGVELHSYKDKLALSEDIMYQGQWLHNKPNNLSKRKCIPIANKTNNSDLKKRVLDKEIIKPSRPCSKESSSNKITGNKCITPRQPRQPLLSVSVIATNSKQESGTKRHKIKRTQFPITTCTSTYVQPFRNILKAPSKFPLSNLPWNNPKSLIVKKSPIIQQFPPLKKDENPPRKGIKKNYIPRYLRQRVVNIGNTISETDLNLNLKSVTTKVKKGEESPTTPKLLVRSKTEGINTDRLKFRSKLLRPEYYVFRNEIESNKNDGKQTKSTVDSGVRKKDATKQYSSTPTTFSANSSTCSSPSSITTVKIMSTRTKNVTTRRRSSSSHLNATTKAGSQNSTPEINRKCTKRCKISCENKENIPQTSKHFYVGEKDTSNLSKNTFIGNKKADVYVAQIKDSLQSTAKTPSKQKIQKSYINIPSAKSLTEKKSSPWPCSSPSNKTFDMLDASISSILCNEISECAQTSNMVLIIEPQSRDLETPINVLNSKEKNSLNPDFIAKNNVGAEKLTHENHLTTIDVSPIVAVDINSIQSVNTNVREWLEHTLEFIDNSVDKNLEFVDNPLENTTEFINNPFSENSGADEAKFNRNSIANVDSPPSPMSFKTVIASEDNELLPTDIEYALNLSFDTTLGAESTPSLNETQFAATDFDFLSLKSISSGSKFSGYLSADTELSSSVKLPTGSVTAPTSMSVREIFERKKQSLQPAQNKNTTGALADQAFSGFTLNEDPVSGDKPDLVNIIDSETGSLLAVAIPRQATSEELLISARSSESFESCVLDDDAVVPNWLFQLISHQASNSDELEHPDELVAQLPIVDPLFDDNANVVEAPGAGAGAGDGHGIHSDNSQDSSGRGTSVSSSETSSGQPSEVILIDPAAFAAQFELLRDAVEGSVVLAINNPNDPDNAVSSRLVSALQNADPLPFSGGESRRTPLTLPTSASDADADVSSLGTDDLPDSDN